VRYLITGGAGFIGSHLAEYLLDRGHQVLILDDLSTGSIENIRHLKGNPRLSYFLEPIENRHVLAELVDEADAIFHLAAAVGVRLIIESPVHTIETNVNGTQLVLETANKKRKLVFCASTSEVYGKSVRLPFTEDSDLVLGATTKARWSYAASKAVEEFLAISYWKEKRQPVIIGRLFNTVGPRQTGRYGMVLPTFARQAIEGCPITVYGSGQQSRCFSYVGDIVEAIYRLMSNDLAVGEVVNIGSQEEVTIEALARLVKERAGSKSPILRVPYDEAYEPGFEDMVRRVPSVEKLERLAGFVPHTPLPEIVDRVVSHLERKLTQPVAIVSAALGA
jgi:UDP-glucose 4-epimerase